MRLLIAAVGRAKAGPELDLYHQYVRRLSPPPVLKEVEEKRPLTGAQLKAREAELLLATVPEGAVVVALDEKGRDLGSVEFASMLVREAQVAVSPGVGFGPGGEGHVRFALIENEQRINQAVRNLKRALPKLG